MGCKMWEKFKKRLTHTDYLLVKLSCIAFGLMLATLIPPLSKINGWWYLLVSLVLAVKPLWTALGPENKEEGPK